MTPDEEREEMRRHFGVLTEDVQSQLRMVAEGAAMTTEALHRLNGKVDAFRDETVREFAAVRREAKAFRDETARSVAVVHGEIAAVRSEADAFRVETARNFAAVRSEIAGKRAGVRLPRRPRTRRRPN